MVVIGAKGSMVIAKNSVRICTRNYADWKLLKNGCRESPRCDDSDSDDAFEPDEVIIEGPEQSLAGPSGDAVPADRPSESRHEQPRANSDTAEYESRQRSRQPGSDCDTERRHAPLDRPRRKTRSTRTLNIRTLFANSEHLLVYYIRACKGHKGFLVISNI